MAIVAGIRFKPAGKVYYFDPGGLDLPVHTGVIVETARGLEYGTVVVEPREVADEDVVQPLKQVIRSATPEDLQRLEDLAKRNEQLMQIARERIAAHGLAMHLVEVESTFDGSKLIFQFTAEQRIDFRELVRDLASRFRARIELRQIGVRDEAKLLGGIGMCGRELCCSTWMTEFMPVSIRMAKDQNLSLNPAKISGVCGRLLCCLRFELDPGARGKTREQLAAEPSEQELELAHALQEDMLAAAESAPTGEPVAPAPLTAVSMPTRRERPRRAQPPAKSEQAGERSQKARAGPRPPQRAKPEESPSGGAANATPAREEKQGRSRRRRRSRRPQSAQGATASSAPSEATAPKPTRSPRRRRSRRPGGPGRSGESGGPAGAGGPGSAPE